MYPIQTKPLNLNFRQNQAHIWKVRMMPRSFMPLTLLKKYFFNQYTAKSLVLSRVYVPHSDNFFENVFALKIQNSEHIVGKFA